jgi:excisionase family DNA binding protein
MSQELIAQQHLFCVEDAAKYLRSLGAASVTVSFVRALIAFGQLAHIRMGKRFYVARAGLNAWHPSHERRMK